MVDVPMLRTAEEAKMRLPLRYPLPQPFPRSLCSFDRAAVARRVTKRIRPTHYGKLSLEKVREGLIP